MAKRIISACIEQVIEFDSEIERQAFICNLKNGNKEFRIVNQSEQDEKFRIRVQIQYNKNSLIEQ